ncbi:MAG: chemotaxis protein CheA [Parasporobacterium sp.]|nr:chemotaxis protein CheA [Parasporobacterium sp.]
MDVSQYLEIFIDETKEHLQSLSDHLMILEKEPENSETINEIFRAAHSLKGMAGTMGYKRMQKLTHNMENVFSEVRNGKMTVDSGLVDLLFQCLDALENYLDTIASTQSEGEEDNQILVDQLDAFLNGGGSAAAAPAADAQAAAPAADAQATAEAPAAAAGGAEIEYADFEKHAIQEGLEGGMNIYEMRVSIQDTCVLRSARAFLVFKHLEGNGDIIKSVPSVQDIEDEKFDFHFDIAVISEKSFDEIKKLIMDVSEISDVTGRQITDINQVKVAGDDAEDTSAPAVEQTTAPAKAESTAPAAKKNDKKPAAKKEGGKEAKAVVSRTVRVDIEKLDVLMNLVSELIIAKNGLVSANGESSDNATANQSFNEQIEYLERVTTNLHESVMKVRMMPIETVTQKFPRMIRDLAKKTNKKLELTISGEETELDRTVIDEIGDPLMHLLRNSADHGIESDAALRAQRGKTEVGNISLKAYQDGNNVVIEVEDDGNGIDVEKVRNKAIEKGTITEEQAETMNDQEVIDLLFKPSFSTAEKVSDISGRGVGLDVVKTKIEALGGDIEVKSRLGEGSTFIIRLPLTLAIIQALMVEIGDEKYAISLGSIQTIEDIEIADIKLVQNKEVINLRDSVIPIIRLNEILDIESKNQDASSLTVVIVKKGDKTAGLVVDELIGQQEIVIKSLGKYINNGTKLIGGATILGNGDVALILDVNTLV